MEKLFNIDNVESIIKALKEGLKFPYINVYYSTLGGVNNISILLSISKDSRDTWHNGIFENSCYANIHILNNGEVEHFSGYKLKLRKFKSLDINKIIEKINNIKVISCEN